MDYNHLPNSCELYHQNLSHTKQKYQKYTLRSNWDTQ